jgi:UDPglucose 6-dehydrogenase
VPGQVGTPDAMRISVLGTGYLGATHAACLTELGHEVVGVDNDRAKVERLRTGSAPFHEPDLDGLLHRAIDCGRLSFCTDFAQAAEFAQVHFLCVGTPQRADGNEADLSMLWSAVDELAPLLRRPCTVVGKSTVPVGTAAQLRDRVQARAPAGQRVDLAWNPEFLREGHAVADSLQPERLVFGVETPAAATTLRRVYAPLLEHGTPTVVTDLATAELAKAAANVMLAARVSLVNLMAEVCEEARGNIGDLTTILGLDHRIGSRFLHPGVGFGGGCLPKDTRAFFTRAEQLGVGESARLLREVDAVNLRQRTRTVDLALAAAPPPRRAAILGAAFKAQSDDVRDSPALDVAARIQARGVDVRVYDPCAVANAKDAQPQLEYAEAVEDACADADVVLVLTEWAEFRALDPHALGRVVRRRRVIDGRLVLDQDAWADAGWEVRALGRGRLP